MIKSESPLIASLFYTPSSEEPTKEAPQGTPTRNPKKEAATKKERTVFASFRASLRSLSATLETTSARYIRCVKPNAKKVQAQFDGRYIAQQLQNTGVYAVVELQQCGYPVSLTKAGFLSSANQLYRRGKSPTGVQKDQPLTL